MANGKVLIGFSKPYVAVYSEAGGVVTYSSGQALARGVSVSIEAETSDDNIFYADNAPAESAGAVFTGGTATVTVDGLKATARTIIFGLPAPETYTVSTGTTVSVYNYGDGMTIPYVGLGFIAMYQEDGVISYEATILPKVKFNLDSLSANTKGEEIEWQTQELSAQIFRDDTSNHNWKKIAAEQSSETAAEAIIKSILSIS